MAKYSLINGTYTISKQSFVSEKTDQTLNLQDPNFWQIILKTSESRTQKVLKQFEDHHNIISGSLAE
jgi:chromodomain-helicase-DNA-binding protein 7